MPGISALEYLGEPPVKLLEYVYLRIPVVAPRLEIIQSYFDERMLKYYEPENAADLAKSIVELYKCPKERDSFVKNASSFYERRSWKTQAAEYVKLLSGLWKDSLGYVADVVRLCNESKLPLARRAEGALGGTVSRASNMAPADIPIDEKQIA